MIFQSIAIALLSIHQFSDALKVKTGAFCIPSRVYDESELPVTTYRVVDPSDLYVEEFGDPFAAVDRAEQQLVERRQGRKSTGGSHDDESEPENDDPFAAVDRAHEVQKKRRRPNLVKRSPVIETSADSEEDSISDGDGGEFGGGISDGDGGEFGGGISVIEDDDGDDDESDQDEFGVMILSNKLSRNFVSPAGMCGMDNFMVHSESGRTLMLVADGAGKVPASSEISHLLASNFASAFEKSGGAVNAIFDDMKATSKSMRQVGGSTLTAAIIEPSRSGGLKLRLWNQGDSAALLVRHGKVIHQTIPGVHAFNMPKIISRFGKLKSLSNVEIEEFAFEGELKAGDIIITASDGLLDNIHRDELMGFVQREWSGADEITDESLNKLSHLIQTMTTVPQSRIRPFFENAPEGAFSSSDKRRLIGKPDDTSVVVALITNY